MLKLKHVVTFLLTLLLIPISANAVHIHTLNGPSSAFRIERNKQKLKKIAPFKPLQAGDKITVRKPTHDFDHIKIKENSITLILDDETLKTLKYADTQKEPYTVAKTIVDSPNVLIGVMNTISAWFNSLWINDIQSVQLHIQGDSTRTISLSMRLFKGNNAKLIAANRELHLAWYGGTPPYQVQVSQIGTKKTLWDKKNIETPEIHLEKQCVIPGHYQVVVTDAQNNKVTGKFTAVAKAPLLLQQSEAQAIEQSDLPTPSKKTLLAAWLAKQEKGTWGFEAYQWVVEITGYYPARLVKQGIERGKHLK
jgi:hypothetical protein